MIAGVDIGVRSAHVALFNEVGALMWVQSHHISKMSSRGAELRALMNAVTVLRSTDVVTYVEEPPSAGAQAKRTFLQLGQTCGALLATASHGYLVPVSSWKKEMIGNGSATKEAVSAWLATRSQAYHAQCDADQNRIDAVVIGLYGVLTVTKSTQLRNMALS